MEPRTIFPVRSLPALSLFPGDIPAHDAKWSAVGKGPISTPTSATTISTARRSTARNGVQAAGGFLERGQHDLDPGAELGDETLQVVDVLQEQPQQVAVVVRQHKVSEDVTRSGSLCLDSADDRRLVVGVRQVNTTTICVNCGWIVHMPLVERKENQPAINSPPCEGRS